jgi:NACalpha-BTF3-like transcription factor
MSAAKAGVPQEEEEQDGGSAGRESAAKAGVPQEEEQDGGSAGRESRNLADVELDTFKCRIIAAAALHLNKGDVINAIMDACYGQRVKLSRAGKKNSDGIVAAIQHASEHAAYPVDLDAGTNVEVVMSFTGTSCDEAEAALRNNNDHVYDAMVELLA